MATQKNFAIKNGLTVAGTERISASGDITGSHFGTFNGTSTTRAAGTNNTQLATTAFVTGAISDLVDSAPGTLNTLNELAAALNDDASFSTTITNSIATKLPLTGGTLTGALTMSVSPTVNNARILVQRSNDDSSIAFANNASGTPSSHTWAIGLDYSSTGGAAGNGLAIAYSASGIPSLTGNNLIQFTTTGNVGIGTNNPGDRLVVQKDSTNIEPMLVLKNDNTTDDNGVSIDFSGKDTGGNHIIYGRLQNKYTNHATEKSHLIFFNRNDSGALTEGLRINHDMRMIVNGGTFPSLPTGSTLNVFGDGETLRLDGTGNTSKTIRFRGVSTSNPGIITADGSLKIQNEDANTSININSIRDINYRTTDTNSTAGHHTFYSYNTPIFKLDGSNNYAELRGGSDVRMVFGSTGTPTNNTSNWIRGASSNLMYNTPGVHIWELNGTPNLQIDNQAVLRVGQPAVNSAAATVRAAGTLILEGSDANHRIILRGYQDGQGNVTGNANEMAFYEYGSYAWYTNVITSSNSRTYGMSLYDNTLKIGDYGYNSNSGVIHYGGSGRTYMDFNYNSYGAEIILCNNRTTNGSVSLIQYRTNSTTEGSIIGDSSGLSFNTPSDYRRKENIRDLTGSLDIINSLQPRLFKWKPSTGKPTRDYVGFIAHEIQEKMPNLVRYEKDAVYTQQDIDDGATDVTVGDPKYQMLSYSDNEMITRLVGAIQEQQTIIDDLKSRIETLEG